MALVSMLDCAIPARATTAGWDEALEKGIILRTFGTTIEELQDRGTPIERNKWLDDSPRQNPRPMEEILAEGCQVHLVCATVQHVSRKKRS